MSETEILGRFKKSLISFLDELIGQFPREEDLVTARILLTTQVSTKSVMDKLNHMLNSDGQELQRRIQERDESSLLEDGLLESTLGGERASKFRHLWRSGRLDDEDKRVMWDWIDLFVRLGGEYSRAIANRS